MNDRIGDLRLRIRAPAGHAPGLRSTAERFARRVLEHCAEALERNAPGRLVFINRLPVHWQPSSDRLDDADHTSRLGEELARSIESQIADHADPRPGDDLAVFDDEAHWRAAFLRDRSRRVFAWYHAAIETDGGPLGPANSPLRGEWAARVLDRLDANGDLVEILAALPSATIAEFVAALDLGRPGSATLAGWLHPPQDLTATRLDEIVAAARALPVGFGREARTLALYARARRLLGPTATEAELRSVLRCALADAAPLPTTPAPGDVPVPGPATTGGPGAATRFGGLFYLLTPILELGIGERLWMACLPEGEVLAAALSALLGPRGEEDPAPPLFGGVAGDRPCPPVSAEQQAEIAAALVASLAESLPRRGLARLPEVVLGRLPGPSGTQLIATAAGSPFPLFAQPAGTMREADAGVRAFLGAWPRSAPAIHAHPLLAELDPTGRLRADPSARVADVFLPAAPTAAAAALLALIVGTAANLVLARTGETVGTAVAFAARFLERPARVILGEESLIVRMAADQVDHALRRAGLDRDPGWTPWLGRTVTFEFIDEEDF